MKTNELKASSSDGYNIDYGAPWGSILGPLMLNIGLIALFFGCEYSRIASHADDTTPHILVQRTQQV